MHPYSWFDGLKAGQNMVRQYRRKWLLGFLSDESQPSIPKCLPRESQRIGDSQAGPTLNQEDSSQFPAPSVPLVGDISVISFSRGQKFLKLLLREGEGSFRARLNRIQGKCRVVGDSVGHHGRSEERRVG